MGATAGFWTWAAAASPEARAPDPGLQSVALFGSMMYAPQGNPWVLNVATLEDLLVLSVLAAPLLLLMVFIALTRACRRPLLFGVTHGLRAAALPVACCPVLVYGGLMLGTVRREKALDYGVRQTVAHEGQYLAGQPWPGPVP